MPPTALSEAQYWSEVQLLPTEIEDAVVIFYTYEELNRLAVHDKTLLTSLNKDRLFWQTQMHCLQTLLFITLRSRKEGRGTKPVWLYSTTNSPFIRLCPKPQKCEHSNGNVPVLSAVNSMITALPFFSS